MVSYEVVIAVLAERTLGGREDLGGGACLPIYV